MVTLTRKPLKRHDYDSHVGTTIHGWEVLGVIVSLAETKSPVYFRARCVNCDQEFTPNARSVINGYSKRCQTCKVQVAKVAAQQRVKLPHRPHLPTTQLEDGREVTVCQRCWMQSHWPGWGNPCGRPVA